jgi:hypothetical protein
MNWRAAVLLSLCAIGACSADRAVAPSATTTIPVTPGTASLVAPVTPDVLNNASFETTFDGFTNWSYLAPTNVTRDATHADTGRMATRRVLPVTNGVDLGAQFTYSLTHHGFVAQDRVYSRFYFYLDNAINGILKLQINEDAGFNTQLGGLYLANRNLNWVFSPEDNTQFFPIRPLAGLTNGWHSVETDYWRNGDPSGNPSVAIWIDGVAVTGSSATPAPGHWSNGRLNAGQRKSTSKIGVYNMLGVLNGNPHNTVAGNIWIDKVAISTRGRIGP